MLELIAVLSLAAPAAESVPVPAPLPTAVSTAGQQSFPNRLGRMAIANRADGTVSIVDSNTDTVQTTFGLPAAANPDETMYCVFAPRSRRLFVGDRGNDRVVGFDAETFAVLGEAATGAGVFHMWMTTDESQMWVVNDVDLSMTVFDPLTFATLATIPIPQDLSDDGGKPHDVVIAGGGDTVFLSIIGLSDGTDAIVAYDTDSFLETGRIDVGGTSPHMVASRANGQLYVTVQGGNAVEIYDSSSLAFLSLISVPNAHGIGFGFRERWLYAVNIADGGPDAIYTIDTSTDTLVSPIGVDTSTATPHNVAVTPNGRKLYLTHSDGTGTKVSVFSLGPPDGVPAFLQQIDVGTNPYGICALF